jgi:hypothetical protein
MLLNALITGRPQLFFYPATFGEALLDRVDTAIALLRVVIAGVHDDDLARVGEQTTRQVGHVLFRDRHDDEVLVACCFGY